MVARRKIEGGNRADPLEFHIIRIRFPDGGVWGHHVRNEEHHLVQTCHRVLEALLTSREGPIDGPDAGFPGLGLLRLTGLQPCRNLGRRLIALASQILNLRQQCQSGVVERHKFFHVHVDLLLIRHPLDELHVGPNKLHVQHGVVAPSIAQCSSSDWDEERCWLAVPPNLVELFGRSTLLVPRYRAGPVNLGITGFLTKTPPSWILFIGT